MPHFYRLDSLFFVWLFLTITIVHGQSTAIYELTFTSIWNASDHTSIPANAHWSDLVGATHHLPNTFLEIGQLASNGIKDVAELGSNTLFESEVHEAMSSGKADQWLQGVFSPHDAISSATITGIQVSEDHPLLTLVAMIAPSPDWFIAINSLNLRTVDNLAWKSSFSMDVFAYDAGTDDGIHYNSDNSISTPPVGIARIDGAPFNGQSIGTLTVILQSVLGLNENTLNDISIFPNPTDGTISISNVGGTRLKNIEIYNSVGQLMRLVSISEHTNVEHIDLGPLKKGLYLVKLNTEHGPGKIQKLVFQ
ncbi:spondin domain-containing protein [Aestuariivivens sediminis]|uniref:T9SS type A sorting domain-containing protein n=1 Tax=Aestuariivivens sediminis TaxID=2913557 RepID=UPI001F578246|nr:spondin domain-containing protein [Aestuariivivens sediminis]